MTRGLTSAVKTELATGNITAIEPVYLLYLGFGTPLYRTNCSFDLTSSVSGSSQTYTADGFFLGLSHVSETTNPIKNTFNVTVSGVNQSILSTILNENIINDSAKVWQGFLDSNNALIADPFLLFDGTINKYSIKNKYTYTLHLDDNINNICVSLYNPTLKKKFATKKTIKNKQKQQNKKK